MQQFSFSALEHSILSSLRDQTGVTEILDAGFVAGVEHDGVIVGISEPGVTSRVFLEVASQPVIDHRIANVVLEKLSSSPSVLN